MSGVLQTESSFRGLVQRLKVCPVMLHYGHEEPETLAHALSDIEESARKLLDEQIPRLLDPKVEGGDLQDLLFDIREECRHILYHLHDPQFFRALEPTHDWLIVKKTTELNGQT